MPVNILEKVEGNQLYKLQWHMQASLWSEFVQHTPASSYVGQIEKCICGAGGDLSQVITPQF